MEQHSLDHDDGIDGFSCERTFMLRPRKQVLGGAPAMVMAQIHKDKNIFTLQVRAYCLLACPSQLLETCLLVLGTRLTEFELHIVAVAQLSVCTGVKPPATRVLIPTAHAMHVEYMPQNVHEVQLRVGSANKWALTEGMWRAECCRARGTWACPWS